LGAPFRPIHAEGLNLDVRDARNRMQLFENPPVVADVRVRQVKNN
jgi:hypothetical protein